jgi:hypothetical protein
LLLLLLLLLLLAVEILTVVELKKYLILFSWRLHVFYSYSENVINPLPGYD